jgi:trimethylamine--corrinoid protein Co-methyltransferase
MRANYQVNATPQFRVLSDDQIEEVFYAALDVLERVGARLYGEDALALVREAGCLVSQEQGSSAGVSALVRMPPWLVKTALTSAPQRIVIAGRDRSKRMHLEKDKIYFGTGSDCPSLVDPYSDELRKYTYQDVYNAARIADALPHIDFHMSLGNSKRCCRAPPNRS